ncbi:MAG: polysaccharide deacetylase family protein [Acidobacteria bacterium]|nr:polysaccharide deacetylase family protein [Acidobacteriota bacterium]
MSKTFLIIFTALACVCVPTTTQTSQSKTPHKAIALTFDDLPYNNPAGGNFLEDAKRVTDELMRVLKAHKAPSVGFVNEGKLHVPGELKARTALLKQWADAGMLLGNHTYSHPDFNTQTVRQFQDEIIKGEVVTRQLMKAKQPYQLYFRHPMTHTGDTKEKKEAIEKFLAERGYKVTPHTIENSDFIFNTAYVRAKQKKDEALMKKLREAYLEFNFAATDFAEQVSPKIFGREIPQLLLLHAIDINADCLDEMLRRYEARGYRFATLDEVMSDPAYQTKDTLVAQRGPTWLWRWNKSLGLNLSFKDDPETPQWIMDLFNQR